MDIISSIPWWTWILIALVIVAVRDVFFNRRHVITHNFPIVGHFRYMLESIGPELRQYIVANNREELPFNRAERSWIYASAKNENNYEGFGTDKNIYGPQYIYIKNAMFPYKVKKEHANAIDPYFLPCAKVMGDYNKRRRPFRPASIINVSAMSFGSLSARAVESLNKGCKLSFAYHNTGEGGYSPYHDKGGDVIFHIGTGYFGVRDDKGNFSIEMLKKLTKKNPSIRAIEVKLSQGAKPGKGGVLPGSKITEEIAEIRGVKVGEDVLSPAYHTAFSTVSELVDFVELIAEETGLPVGIKAAVGKTEQWTELVAEMKKQGKGPDFVTIDGGEGGTGAAPPSFADHVALPWVYGFAEIYKLFKNAGITERLVFCASGKLGFPARAAMAFAMGVDCINVAREAMLSVGCIQAQVCHTNRCPTGITTQSKWLQAGIDVTDKAERVKYYFKNFNKELLEITHACGYEHPSQFTMNDINISQGDNNATTSLEDTYRYKKAKVSFNSINELATCPDLGGGYCSAPVDVAEVRY